MPQQAPLVHSKTFTLHKMQADVHQERAAVKYCMKEVKEIWLNLLDGPNDISKTKPSDKKM